MTDPWFTIRKQPDHPAPWVVFLAHHLEPKGDFLRFWTWQEAMDWINNK